MIRHVALSVMVFVGPDIQHDGTSVTVFEITEGDHVWNTLVGDRERDGIIDVAPCVHYLKGIADDFSRDHPEPLRFKSTKKAHQFGTDIIQRPVSLRGPYHLPLYPGENGVGLPPADKNTLLKHSRS